MLETLGDLWGYMRAHKKLWLAPFIAILLVVGVAMLYEATIIAPFVYTLF